MFVLIDCIVIFITTHKKSNDNGILINYNKIYIKKMKKFTNQKEVF